MRTRSLAAAGALTVAAGALVARRRAAGRERSPVPPPAPLPRGRVRTVTTEDGVDLHVEVSGSEQPTATVVLAHGYVQSSRLWAGQVHDLLDARPDLAVVTYDHRGHGASGSTTRDRATIEQLGRDLAQVLEQVVPDGPVVLGGHSMGGMTLMALAEQRPELFGDRVAGVAFVGTSSGGLDAVTYGLPAPLARVVKKALPVLNERAVTAELAGRKRAVGKADMWLVFGGAADPADVRTTIEVHRGTTAETVAAFLPTFSDHDRLTALSALTDVPVLIAVGDADRLCPVEHSRALAEALPTAELAVYPGAGHMVQLERRPEVSRQLLALVERALAAPGAPVPAEHTA
ncbi:Pimeloyl-ACP methyl ester carboxylesterase [Geodermatophilus telluris]|uniref:Pimeloyl-ACP methyl ester carboxylesterase n=1 Tax=Geodermatophilus telluris TaxID=1190417 RepID=A0A1G6MAX6_9ACTN|nr:alpha/beta fold hydrolase [Geodermatophilus telluris]SDC52610.1 Pimeloyl-ACP methyl ester carboxylesterase [Geodermatophilus telluris]